MVASMSTAAEVCDELNGLGNATDAKFLQRFFKTGEGQYGAGDVFIGVRVPAVRRVAAKYKDLSLEELPKLLASPVHEHRLAAVIIMTNQSKRADEQGKRELYDLYLRSTDRINNWDIVDVSCRDVVGGYLAPRSKQPLYVLARSKSIWERRIAIVSTWQFIREGELDETFKIAAMLGDDSHDLIHKAVGWMLREAGKKDETRLRKFLDQYAATMPRTMLRYSIERLPSQDRQAYMRQKELTV